MSGQPLASPPTHGGRRASHLAPERQSRPWRRSAPAMLPARCVHQEDCCERWWSCTRQAVFGWTGPSSAWLTRFARRRELPASAGRAGCDSPLQKALAIGDSLARGLCSSGRGTAGQACITGRLREAAIHGRYQSERASALLANTSGDDCKRRQLRDRRRTTLHQHGLGGLLLLRLLERFSGSGSLWQVGYATRIRITSSPPVRNVTKQGCLYNRPFLAVYVVQKERRTLKRKSVLVMLGSVVLVGQVQAQQNLPPQEFNQAVEKVTRQEVTKQLNGDVIFDKVEAKPITINGQVGSQICGVYHTSKDPTSTRFIGFLSLNLLENQQRPDIFSKMWDDGCVRGIVNTSEYFELARRERETK